MPAVAAALGTTAFWGMTVGQVVAYSVTAVSLYDSYRKSKNLDSYDSAFSGNIKGNKQSNNAPIPVVYGERVVGGTRVFVETTDDGSIKNAYLHMVYVLGEGEVNAITDVYYNDVVSTDSRWGYFVDVDQTPLLTEWEGTNWAAVNDATTMARDYVATNATSYLAKPVASQWTPTVGETYSIVFEIGEVTGGSVKFTCGGYTGGDITTAGVYTHNFTATTTATPSFVGTAFTGKIRIQFAATPVDIKKDNGASDRWVHTGTDSQAADGALVALSDGKWTASHKLSGIAYVYVRLYYNRDAFDSIPTVTANVQGKKCLDIRDATQKYTTNPALCLYDYLTNSRYGRGIPTSSLDTASFVAAANHCDELITVEGNSQKRYELNGVVDPSRSDMDIVSEMLSSCFGWLVKSGEKYKLVIEQVASPTFDFDEDNILGEWSITTGSKRNQFNRVTTTFFNPEKNWEQDTVIIDSPTLRTEDNGILLELSVDLPFTSNSGTAKQISTIILNKSRRQVGCQFKAHQDGARVEVGDVVTITHSTPGWTNKLFRVVGLSLMQNDEVGVTCIEYDANVYDFGTILAGDPISGTTLPNPFDPSLPSGLAVTTESAGFNGAIEQTVSTLTWTAAQDQMVVGYTAQYKKQADTEWTALPVSETSAQVYNLSGIYDFRVRSETASSSSRWVGLGSVTISYDATVDSTGGTGGPGVQIAPGPGGGLSVGGPGGTYIYFGPDGTGGLVADSDFLVTGTLTVGQDLIVAGNMALGGDLIMSGSMAIGTDLVVVGDMSLGGDLTMSGSLAVGTDLTVVGDLALGGNLTMSGTLDVGAGLNVQGDVTIGSGASSLTLAGSFTAGPGFVAIDGTLDVGGALTVEGVINGTDCNLTNLNASNISTGSMNASFITAGTITTDRMTAGTIDADRLVAGSITAVQMGVDSVSADELQANSVTAAKITADAINASHIQAGVISGTHITTLDLSSKTFTADTGTIGGWEMTSTLLRSATTGARIQLDQSKNRISVFDVISEKVAMGYLDGLPKNDGSGSSWGASDYGFWAKQGDNLVIDGDVEYKAGDWIVENDASYKVQNSDGIDIIRLGTDTGHKGLFIYGQNGAQISKIYDDGLYIGDGAAKTFPTSIVGHWTFDGHLKDVSGGNHHLTESGSEAVGDGGGLGEVQFKAGVGNGLGFSGSGSAPYITELTGDTSSAFDFTTGDYSISFWLNLETIDQVTVIERGVVNTSGWSVSLGGSDGIYALALAHSQSGATQYAVSDPLAKVGKLTHFCVIREGATVTFYIDGRLSATTYYVGTMLDPATNTNSLKVNSGLDYISGVLDELLVFDKALTSSEVGVLHAAPNGDIRNAFPDNSNLLAHWDFNGEETTVIPDVSGAGYDATIVSGGVVTYSDGVSGKASHWSTASNNRADFDDDVVDVSTDDFTVSLWFNCDRTASSNNRIMGIKGTEGLQIMYSSGSTGKIIARIDLAGVRQDSVQTNNGYTLNEWHHLVVQCSGGAVSDIYVDGVKQATAAETTTSGTAQSQIGDGAATANQYHWDGYLDEIRIYSALLSPQEIKALTVIPGDGYGSYLEYDKRSGDISFSGTINDRTPWVNKQTDFTAVAGKRYRIDTSGATASALYLKMTLPSSPKINDAVQWIDLNRTFGDKYLYIDGGSENIEGVIAGYDNNIMYCLNPGENGVLTYTGPTYGWKLS